MKVNYHTHTCYCRHAKGSPLEFVKKALDCNIKILGFSDHAPFPDYDFGMRMSYAELPQYYEEIDRLKQNYASKLLIYNGLEIEYLPDYTKNRNYYEYLLYGKKFDYLLLAEHFFRDRKKALCNIYSLTSTELVIDYALASAEAMYTGYFNIFAHPDIFGVGNFAWDNNYDKASDIIIQAAEDTGVILEYNANGYRRGIQQYPDGNRFMYPLDNFWNKVSKTGIPVIIGSDSHNPDNLWDAAIEFSLKQLKRIGIKPIERVKIKE